MQGKKEQKRDSSTLSQPLTLGALALRASPASSALPALAALACCDKDFMRGG